ncbi:MAG: hypothetical protein V3R23_07690 [Nitrospinaceae bacterium]
MKDRNPQRSISSWVELLKNRILVTDVDAATVAVLCCHLADLGVLEKAGEEDWKLIPYSDGSLTVDEEMEKLLNDLCATEQGFALRYFLKDPPATPITNGSQGQGTSEVEDNPKSNPQLLEHKTSNLSNLQIVKKYGRQVQSFMELEKSYTERLLGPHTTLKEARKIFNFILSRMKQKTEPRPWEQLSRRRHK